MSDKHRFYAACLIAVLALVAIGIGYATGALPLHKQSPLATQPAATTEPTQRAANARKTTAAKQKNCGCCAERRAKARERLKKIRERKQTANIQAAATP